MKYVLASASARRQELLQRIISEFDIEVSNFDESAILFNGDIEEYVVNLAKGKAISTKEKLNKDAIIIGGDTIVVLNDKILGKPKDEKDAYRMLKELSGKTHRVYSGIVVINMYNNKIEESAIYTEVKMGNLTDKEILDYIKTGEPLDKAGAYGIQGYGGIFVEEIKGCFYNVVGLPLNLLNKMLNKVKE
ncbi:Maf-like protein [Clostridium sp. AL.422]|uniref:Maf-like protein n=1 Tax=Clostridium TaxID=1485 RepID=UPI00293DDB4B|nr:MULTISPECIES: Maf-like protein [unclassified Clostridium]MDV4149986.1 Maf-like protein [Clostridium sp. AL.422]